MTKVGVLYFIALITGLAACQSQQDNFRNLNFAGPDDISTGAQRTDIYFPWLENKTIAVCANYTSMIENIHLVDSLVKAGYNVVRIFSPEHGYRGTADAGAGVENSLDQQTGIPVVSLYGKHKKPYAEELQDIDIMIFDIQDVGVRFYTYISTLTYVMEACAAEGIPVIITDRPNPNGFYVDGPVLDTAYRSFVGLHPIPIVYGMTIAEYANMINGEYWLKDSLNCDLKIVPMQGYDHNMIYKLPVNPSPNLPGWESVYLYPSLALFEGTVVSVGRGTAKPFRIIGHPDLRDGNIEFMPVSTPGASLYPKYQDQLCFGYDLTAYADNAKENRRHIILRYLIDMYGSLNMGDDFFNSYFEKLAGTATLRQQIINGQLEQAIRESWEKELKKFMEIRKKYLLYPDFLYIH